MRARDVRAILFWITSSLVLLAMSFLATHGVIASAAVTGAYNAWLLTRPRMRRVFRRMRGETTGFSGYYLD